MGFERNESKLSKIYPTFSFLEIHKWKHIEYRSAKFCIDFTLNVRKRNAKLWINQRKKTKIISRNTSNYKFIPDITLD